MDGRPYELTHDRSGSGSGRPDPGGGFGSAPPPYEQREFTVGNVVGETFELYRRFFVHFVSIALAVFLATNLVAALATVPSSDTTAALIAVVAVVAAFVGFFALQGALTVAVEDVRDGRVDLSWRQLADRTRYRLPQLVGAGVLIGLALGGAGAAIVLLTRAAGATWLGVIVVLAGGLFLITRWSLVTPIVVLEGAGPVAAMKRSWALVRGHGVRVFLIILVTGLIAGITSGIIRGILNAALSGFLAVWLSSTAANALTTPFVALAWTLMYFHLREPEEATSSASAIPSGAAYSDE